MPRLIILVILMIVGDVSEQRSERESRKCNNKEYHYLHCHQKYFLVYNSYTTMLSRPSSSFECSYKLLAERETTRLVYSQPVDDPTPQHTFFSVSRSLRNGSGNRYSNVLSYDRTCVASESQTYLNANVVSDLTSRWWIASQVRQYRGPVAHDPRRLSQDRFKHFSTPSIHNRPPSTPWSHSESKTTLRRAGKRFSSS